MADPFSVFTGALTVGDVCLRVAKYLKGVQTAAKNFPDEFKKLENEVEAFNATYTRLAELCKTKADTSQKTLQALAGRNDPTDSLWKLAVTLVKEGEDVVQKLREVLVAILGSPSTTKFHVIKDVRAAMRMSSRSGEYAELRSRFTTLNRELGMILTAINLISNALFHSQTLTSLEQLPNQISQSLRDLILQLKRQIDSIQKDHSEEPQPSIASAKAAVEFASLNKHFYVQKPDPSIWTGRKSSLERLRDAILDPDSIGEQRQKRFVVYGIPGAGKTQLCCKFAQDYRESFWGIFWVDASSVPNATESWKKIAQIGGKDLNEEAGKYWLSNLQSPWLLIIDSADGSEESIRSQFPSGGRGSILITTRNQYMRVHETVGYMTLDRLEEDEANDLLRRATKHEPWDDPAKISASSIAKHLGYLPLALIHAGKAIFHRLCDLHGYIPFFNKSLEEFRRKKHAYFMESDDDEIMSTFTSFDIIYSGLEVQAYREGPRALMFKDAVEFINVFAFLHYHDIKIEIISNAGRNIVQSQAVGTGSEELRHPSPSVSILEKLYDLAIDKSLNLIRPSPALPQILSEVGEQGFSETRVRKAIDLLVRMSLLSENSERGSYSMHPLVHVWVRKRLGTSAQALWCGVAANVLANSIKLPPMTDEPGDQDLYRRMLPHIAENRRSSDEIRFQLQQNCDNTSYIRRWVWLPNPTLFTAGDAINSAKYSRVYAECSKFDMAEKLLRSTRDFVISLVGRKHRLNVPVAMGLSKILWLLARARDAQEVLEEALNICQLKLGESHSQTLLTMDALGETYWQMGKLKEAKKLHQSAIDGMRNRSEMKRDRLKAMTHLGHVHEWYTEFDKAKELHQAACDEMTAAYGSDDLDTLVARDSLAMTLLQTGEVSDTKQANEIMQEIYKKRSEILGEEHLYTLWAACNVARTFTQRGILEKDGSLILEAKKIFHDGLEITMRNLGPRHLGTLMGRTFLAEAIAAEKNYELAEREFREVSELQKSLPGSRDGKHRDRFYTLNQLVDCYQIQGKYRDALATSKIIKQELDDLGGQEHPWRVNVVKKQEELLGLINAADVKVKLDSDQ